MDQIQKILVQAGRKDLAQKYYEKVSFMTKKIAAIQNVLAINEEAIQKIAVSPPGWSGTVEQMKDHPEITNPWALAWWMSQQKSGDSWGSGGKLEKTPKPHFKEKKK